MGPNRRLPVTFFAIAVVLAVAGLSTPAAPQQEGAQLEKLLSQLPQKKRKLLDEIMKRADRQNRKLSEEKLRLKAQMDSLLEAPDFDQRTYLDKSAKLGTLRAKICANMDDAIALAAAQFTPQERKVLIHIHALELEQGDQKEWSPDEEDDHRPSTQ